MQEELLQKLDEAARDAREDGRVCLRAVEDGSMTEQEWLRSDDPRAMLAWAASDGSGPGEGANRIPASDRKFRLFACSCWRLGLARAEETRESGIQESRGRLRSAIAVAEDWADGGKSLPNREHAVLLPDAHEGVFRTLEAPSLKRLIPAKERAALLRDIFGNPFRSVELPKGLVVCRYCGGRGFTADTSNENQGFITCGCKRGVRHTGPCPWFTADAMSLARVAYEDRLADGTLDPFRLALVADALEDAGCDNEAVLAHLRSPGPHVRGCWALDLVLGKE